MARRLPTLAEPLVAIADLDTLFKGFADPTRLRILNVLAAGDLCVCDVVDVLRLSQPTVSRHLAYLRRMGLVKNSREGKFAHYRLAVAENAVHRHLIDCARSCFVGVPALDRERRQATKRAAARALAPC